MITLEDLRNATGGQLFGEIAADQFTGITDTPRSVQAGSLFVPPKSYAGDSRRAIADALALGASGILCEEPPPVEVAGATVILVGDTEAALGQWAAYILRQYGTIVIALTGLFGKKHALGAIAAVLGSRYSIFCCPNAVSGRAALGLALGGLRPDHQVAVVGLSRLSQGEIADLLGIVKPQVSVIMGLIPGFEAAHRELERAESEARQVIESLPENGGVVVSYDDSRAMALAAAARTGAVTYARGDGDDLPSANLVATNVQYYVDKVGFDLLCEGQRFKGHWTPAVGSPGLNAALSALAAGLLFEVPVSDGLRALKDVRPVPGQLAILDAVNEALLIDESDDAAAPSTSAALDLLASPEVGEGRRILVIGELSAPHESAEAVHREVGLRAASVCDLLVACGDLPALAGMSARQAGLPEERTRLVYRHSDAVRIVRDYVQPGDVILVTGGQAARMERICAGLLARPEDSALLPQRAIVGMGSEPHTSRAESWIELDLDALVHNLAEIRERVGQNRQVIAIVKGNAYGHGAQHIASTAVQNGASMLGVATLEEGLRLRRAGISEPIVVLGSVQPADALDAIEHRLSLTVYDRDAARALADAARKAGGVVRVHVRVDTGLGDLGLLPQEVVPLVRDMIRMEGLEIEGLYTDFAVAATLIEAAATQEELQSFESVYESLRAARLSIPYVHAANSAAIFTLPASYFTAVRAGASLYGLHPSLDVPCPTGFRRVLAWKTSVAQVKTIPAAWGVGRGSIYRARVQEKIAIIPVGFADGFRSIPRNWGEVLIHGTRAPLVGRVGMTRSAAYVSHLSDVQTGDEVVLIGRQGDEEISAEDVARRLDTTNVELLSGIAPYVPRRVKIEG